MNEIYDDLDELPARPRNDIPAADLALLKLAARAIGAVQVETVDGENWVNLHFEDGSVLHNWNSLLFYGDTFELAVRLDIAVERRPWDPDSVYAHAPEAQISFFESRGHDPVAAAARAVTRAAAEIGKQRSS